MNKFIKQAFTLIELLVVIAIIGILSGLIVVSMGGMTQKATIAKAQVFSNSLRNSMLLNLVSEWKFDGSGVNDGSPATADYVRDTWNGANHCSMSSAATVYSGSNCIKGSCLYSSGSANSINCGNDADLSITDKLTIEFWFSPKSYPTSYAAHLIQKGNSGTTDSNYDLYFFGPTGVYKAIYFYGAVGGVWTNISPGYSITSLSKWYHIAFSYDKTIGGKLYVNGDFIGLLPNSGTLGTNSLNFYMIPGGDFNGYIDEVRVYNSVNSISQIKEGYHAGLNNLLINGSLSASEYKEKLLFIASK